MLLEWKYGAITMKPGIKIIEDTIGDGAPEKSGDSIKIEYDLFLNKGEKIKSDVCNMVLGDRNMIAGFNYGIEGMKVGGIRKFKASPHLCYGDEGVIDKIPPIAVLIFVVHLLEVRNCQIDD